MHEHNLSSPFLCVTNKGTLSYGGNQAASGNKNIARCGCGIVSACDLFLYMHRYVSFCSCPWFIGLEKDEPIPIETYNELLEKLKVFFPIIPPFGINGPLLVLGINLFFKRFSYPYKAIWGIKGNEIRRRTEEMLSNNIPVIISVGPNLPLIWQKYKTSMYVKNRDDTYRKATSVSAHYMTVTSIDDEWICVSSWGRKYYIKIDEYREYVSKHSSSLVSNVVIIKENKIKRSL